jgi:hypothetical protein
MRRRRHIGHDVPETDEERLARLEEERERLHLAGQPHTPPETLRAIGESILYEDVPGEHATAVADALLGNPNTPPELLAQLAGAPGAPIAALCANPILPLLPLEHPEFPHRLNESARRQILRETDPPMSLIHVFLRDRDPEIAEAAALHVAIAGELDPALWESEVRSYLRRLAETPPGVGRAAQRELVQFGFAPDWAADFGPTDREEDDLIAPDMPAARRAVACAILGLDGEARLPADASDALREAFDLTTSPTVLDRLADHEDWIVRLAVTANPSSATGTLVRAAKQVYRGVYQIALVQNPSTPRSLSVSLAREANPALRRAARRGPNARPEWTAAAGKRIERELVTWSQSLEQRSNHGWPRTGDPPTPFCKFLAEWNPPVKGKERRLRIHNAVRSEDHRSRLAAVLSPHLNDDPDGLTRLRQDACRLVRAVARARQERTDWQFTL